MLNKRDSNYGEYITGFQEKEACNCVSIGVTLDDFPSHLSTPSLEQWMVIGEITVQKPVMTNNLEWGGVRLARVVRPSIIKYHSNI